MSYNILPGEFISLTEGKKMLSRNIPYYIFNENTGKMYMECFMYVYNMCTQKPPNNYSSQMYEFVQENLIDLIDVNSEGLNYSDKELKFIKYIYYQKISKSLCKIYRYLNKFHVKRQGLLSIKDLLEKKFMDNYNTTIEELNTQEKQMIKKYKIKQVLAVLQLPIDDNDVLRLICERVINFNVDKKEMLKIHNINIK